MEKSWSPCMWHKNLKWEEWREKLKLKLKYVRRRWMSFGRWENFPTKSKWAIIMCTKSQRRKMCLYVFVFVSTINISHALHARTPSSTCTCFVSYLCLINLLLPRRLALTLSRNFLESWEASIDMQNPKVRHLLPRLIGFPKP